jgi:hypothetical protein
MHDAFMSKNKGAAQRPDVIAEIRGGDTEQAMEGEHDIDTSSMKQAVFWRDTYQEILTMEESVMARVVELMAAQSATSRREVEQSNVPVIAAQVERFRSRLGYWETRLQKLDGKAKLNSKAKLNGAGKRDGN